MKKIILIILVLIGWVTLAVRLYLRITEYDFTALESIIQFFSYFTILTNLLVTVYCTGQLVKIDSEKYSIIHKPETLTALTVFILIVGIVYHIALKPIWNPEGLTMVLSEIHHTLVPLGTLILWLLDPDKQHVRFKKLLNWLLYPAIYLAYVLLRGSFSNFYPYPFLNVDTLGLATVLLNSLVLLVIMFIFLIVLRYIGKRISN